MRKGNKSISLKKKASLFKQPKPLKAASKGSSPSKLRRTNLIKKLLRGKNCRTAASRELILHSMMRGNKEKLKKFDFFSEERQIDKFKVIAAKEKRSDEDMYTVVNMLEEYPKFISVISNDSANSRDILKEVAKRLNYLELPKDRIIFRIGDMGDKFYITLTGTLAVVIPKETTKKMCYCEYLEHLINLSKVKEKYILDLTLARNESVFKLNSETFYDMIRTGDTRYSVESNIYSRRANKDSFAKRLSKSISNIDAESNNDQLENLQELFNRVKPPEIEHEDIRKDVLIFQLEKVLELKRGMTFGDVAMLSDNSFRTATIVTTSACILGVLDKFDYDMSIKEISERVRKQNQSILFENLLFSSILYKPKILKRVSNYFVEESFDSRRKILRKGENSKKVFIVKRGEFQISMKASMKEVFRIIKVFGGKTTDLITLDEYNNSEILRKFVNRPRQFYLKIIGDKEVSGMADLKEGDSMLFDVQMLSGEGSVFWLDYKVGV